MARALVLQVTVNQMREEALKMQQLGRKASAKRIMAGAEAMREAIDDVLKAARSKMRTTLEPLPESPPPQRAASRPPTSPPSTSPLPPRSTSMPASPVRAATQSIRWADYADEQDADEWEAEHEERLRADARWPDSEITRKWSPESATDTAASHGGATTASHGGAEEKHAFADFS